jgi:hypothetical protein
VVEETIRRRAEHIPAEKFPDRGGLLLHAQSFAERGVDS